MTTGLPGELNGASGVPLTGQLGCWVTVRLTTFAVGWLLPPPEPPPEPPEPEPEPEPEPDPPELPEPPEPPDPPESDEWSSPASCALLDEVVVVVEVAF